MDSARSCTNDIGVPYARCINQKLVNIRSKEDVRTITKSSRTDASSANATHSSFSLALWSFKSFGKANAYTCNVWSFLAVRYISKQYVFLSTTKEKSVHLSRVWVFENIVFLWNLKLIIKGPQLHLFRFHFYIKIP